VNAQTRIPPAIVIDACPEPERLAAYIDGSAVTLRHHLQRHLCKCDDCRRIFVQIRLRQSSSAPPSWTAR